MNLARSAWLSVLVIVLCGALVWAQDAPPDGGEPGGMGAANPPQVLSGRIPVRVIAGRLVTICDVSTKHRRLPVNLFVDFEDNCGLQLHNRAAGPGGLRVAANADRGASGFVPITLHFPGFKMTAQGREHGPEDVYEEFTKYYSKELGENALVGTIGAQLLAQYHVTLDLNAGSLYLEPPHDLQADGVASVPGATTVPITVANGVVWIPVKLADDRHTTFGLGTKRHDTLVDADLCERFGRPAGDIGAVRLGDLDFSKYVALRPGEITHVHSDGASGFIGLGLLQQFRVEVDRVNRVAHFLQSAEPKFPQEDLAYFRAFVEEEPEPLLAFLEEHPETRLSPEAAERLIELYLEDGSEPAEFAKAVEWFDSTRIEDLRATSALDLMKELAAAGSRSEIVPVAEKGIESGRKDRYPNAVHNIHARLGDVLLTMDEGKRAWKHLLSAAFGLPEDGMINLNLGRYYERTGRLRRAFSRFVQASIQPESGPQALEGLARVQQALGGAPLDVDEIEELIEGKVQNYSAATRFEPTAENSTSRVVLVEWFTNAHLEQGGLGGALGNEGLITHFPRSHVAVLAHHLDAPSLDPLTNELAQKSAAFYGVGRPVITQLNGVIRQPGAARTRDKEKLYNRLRGVVEQLLMQPSPYFLDLEAKVEGGEVTGSVRVEGPANTNLRVHIVLAERGVLFPGKSKVVVHRYVSRAALTRSVSGARYRPENGEMNITFSRSLDGIKAANLAHLTSLEEAGRGSALRVAQQIDPKQVSIVAFLRDEATKEVLQAAQFDPFPPEDEEEEGK